MSNAKWLIMKCLIWQIKQAIDFEN